MWPKARTCAANGAGGEVAGKFIMSMDDAAIGDDGYAPSVAAGDEFWM